jgi:hypothetical protein
MCVLCVCGAQSGTLARRYRAAGGVLHVRCSAGPAVVDTVAACVGNNAVLCRGTVASSVDDVGAAAGGGGAAAAASRS